MAEAQSSETHLWHSLAPTAVIDRVRADPAGLATEEAKRRLEQYGPNVLPRAAGDGPLVVLWRQINSPLVWVLIASSLLAIGLGKVTDGLVVVAVVVLNAIIGFLQEYRAGKAIEALSAMVPERATALRDGAPAIVDSAELVPGDVVTLASGDLVPADMRLVQIRNLRVEEAALTGESVPVEKRETILSADAAIGDRVNMVFGGTLVTYGTASAVVVATGTRTELGAISNMLQKTHDLETPLTRALGQIGKIITIGVVVLATVMIAIGVARATLVAGAPLGEALRESVMFAIALGVGAIPEGLPAIVTIALAIGVQRMAKRKAVIRKLPAVETLGSTTVICSDKTGTLTRNEMTVVALWTKDGETEVTGTGYRPEGRFQRDGVDVTVEGDLRELLLAGVLCNDAVVDVSGEVPRITGDPTEAALVVSAEKAGMKAKAAREEHPRRDVIPFESEHQIMATLHDGPTGPWIAVKGAPEAVLARCAGVEPSVVLSAVERLAKRGMRVLAVAAKSAPAGTSALREDSIASGLRFLGLQGMIDPPRPEAIEAIKACHAAGITVKMITGDHHATAEAIGRTLGILTERGAMTGQQIAALGDSELREVVRHTNVFARVAPEHKLKLVEAIQENGEIAAMTGDGVNDAPALKRANIGVAMGITGTAVSKEAASVVLTDDNFASIAAAVEEGRRVYDNLVKSLAFVLPTNLGLALILVYAVAFCPFDPVTGELLLPIQPTQILWINLVATVSLALPLAFEAKEDDVMRRPPRSPSRPVLDRFVVVRTALAAILMTAGAVGLFSWEYFGELARGRPDPVALAEAQTMAVTTVVLFQIFYVLHCRSLDAGLLRTGLLTNPSIFVGIGLLLLLQLAFVYLPPLNSLFATAPLAPDALGWSALAAVIVLPIISIEKALWRASRRRTLLLSQTADRG